MYTAITWIIMMICILLIIVVLVQNSKGGGLSQQFAAQQQVMGVRKTTDFLEKSTWTLSASIMILSFISVALIPSNTVATGSSDLDQLLQNQQQMQTPAPSFSTPAATEAEMPEAEAEAPVAE
ncbi:MAG: preprotein translocase subunit SecG [Marinilabiliaceae bacterium]|nr:preprotein translocase subunit SecG [Marinilabiliaceae bacterium]